MDCDGFLFKEKKPIYAQQRRVDLYILPQSHINGFLIQLAFQKEQ